MCNHDDMIRLREIYQNAMNKLAVQALPIMLCLSAHDIAGLPLDSLKGHLQGLEPETLIMINIKSINCCDMATISSPVPIANDCNGHSVYATTGRVTFAKGVEITASEFVHLLDKGDSQ